MCSEACKSGSTEWQVHLNLYMRDDARIFLTLRNYKPPEKNIYWGGTLSKVMMERSTWGNHLQ